MYRSSSATSLVAVDVSRVSTPHRSFKAKAEFKKSSTALARLEKGHKAAQPKNPMVNAKAQSHKVRRRFSFHVYFPFSFRLCARRVVCVTSAILL